MALFPCTVHGTRFKGPAEHWYVFLAHGQHSQRAHLRVCRNCSDKLLEWAQEELIPVPDDYDVAMPGIVTCAGCERPIDVSDQALIMTGYVRKDDPRQLMGGLHAECGMPEWLGTAVQRGHQAA